MGMFRGVTTSRKRNTSTPTLLSGIVQARQSFMVHMSLWRNVDLGAFLGDMPSTNIQYEAKIEAGM